MTGLRGTGAEVGGGRYSGGLHSEEMTLSCDILFRCSHSLDDLGSTVPEDPFVPSPTAVSWSLCAPSPGPAWLLQVPPSPANPA